MLFLMTILLVRLCKAEGTWFPESCDEVNAKLQVVRNVPAETIEASESHAWYVLLRYPIGSDVNTTCERIQIQSARSDKLIFVQWWLSGDQTIKIPTHAKRWDQYGNFTIIHNHYNVSENGRAILKVLNLDLNLVVAAVCYRPVERKYGSEVGAWISTSNTVLSPDQEVIARNTFAENGLDFSALQQTPFTDQCKLQFDQCKTLSIATTF